MARTRSQDKRTTDEPSSSRPFMTPEAEESYCISLAYRLAQQRLLDGTATSQEVVHFLKKGSPKELLEIQRLEEENKLLRAKTETLQSQKNNEEMYLNALNAMRKYSGCGDAYEDF